MRLEEIVRVPPHAIAAAMLVAAFIAPSQGEDDRSDDWSTPRPILYQASAATTRRQPAIDLIEIPSKDSGPGWQTTETSQDSGKAPLFPVPRLIDDATPIASPKVVDQSTWQRKPIVVSHRVSEPDETKSRPSQQEPAARTEIPRTEIPRTEIPRTEIPRARVSNEGNASSASEPSRAAMEQSFAAKTAWAIPVPESSFSGSASRSAPRQQPTSLSSAAVVPSVQQERGGPRRQPPAVAAPTVSGWQLGRLADQKIAHAKEMLRRGATMSARNKAIEALHLIAQANDETTRSGDAADALSQATTAVREAGDFMGRYGSVDPAGLQRLIDAHQTRVLKRCDLSETSALRAADVYFEFARGRFVDAISGWRNGAQALVVLAKTEPISKTRSDGDLSATQVCYLRAAVACDPANPVAANLLGQELLALGIYDEARWALEHSYSRSPSEAALQNLAQLHRIVGNPQLAQACVANLASAKSSQPRVATVVRLTPTQFASMSPQVMATRTATSPGRPRPAPATNRSPAALNQDMAPDAAGRFGTTAMAEALPPTSFTNHVAQPANASPSPQGRVGSAIDRASDAFMWIFQ